MSIIATLVKMLDYRDKFVVGPDVVDVVGDPGSHGAVVSEAAVRAAIAAAGGGANRPASTVSGGYVTRSGTDLLYKPDTSNRVFLYESSVWASHTIPDAGIAVACVGLAQDPVSTPEAYYLYVYDDASTLTLELTTTVPTTQNGINVKTGAADYLFLARCSTAGQSGATGDILTFDVGSSGESHLVSNAYNKRKIPIFKVDTTDLWVYTTQTWRSANYANVGDANRLAFVSDGANSIFCTAVAMTKRSGTIPASGVGIDKTNGNDAQLLGYPTYYSNPTYGSFASRYMGVLGAGYHYAQWVERGDANITFYGDLGQPTTQMGIYMEIMA